MPPQLSVSFLFIIFNSNFIQQKSNLKTLKLMFFEKTNLFCPEKVDKVIVMGVIFYRENKTTSKKQVLRLVVLKEKGRLMKKIKEGFKLLSLFMLLALLTLFVG